MHSAPFRSNLFSLRMLAPAILVLTGAANVCLRLLPPDFLAFRGWEAVTIFVTGIGPFAVNKRYYNPASTGDLAAMANLPKQRHPRPESFSTGPTGFRAYDAARNGSPSGLLLGDSFGAGAAVNDRAYLGARLSEMLAGPVFFAGYFGETSIDTLAALPYTPLVIVQLSERTTEDTSTALERLLKKVLPRRSSLYLDLRYLRDLIAYSPLEIWAGRAFKLLQNDVILPNPYSGNVSKYRLRSGAEMLFLPNEVQHAFTPPGINTEEIIHLKNFLSARRTCLSVILVPNKFTVYYDLLADAPPGAFQGTTYLNALENSLQTASIPTLNLLAAFRTEAASAIKKNQYLYHLDDTHWNDEALAIAAREIRLWLPAACPSITMAR